MLHDTKDKHYTEKELTEFLEKKSLLSVKEVRCVKDHLDFCRKCWNVWNRVRWNKAIGSEGVLELQKYLGDDYIEYFDSSWALANEWNSEERSKPEDVEKFYQNTHWYVYNSLIFQESGDRENLEKDLDVILNSYNVSSVLDYGAGIGSDSLFFLERGLKTYFADFDCPATKFLRFRINKRGYKDAHFVDVKKAVKIPEVELIWTIDTLEHMTDPEEILKYITPKTKVFSYFIDDDTLAGGRHPFHTEFDYEHFNNKLKKRGFKKIVSKKFSLCSEIWSR